MNRETFNIQYSTPNVEGWREAERLGRSMREYPGKISPPGFAPGGENKAFRPALNT
jgi:hypothetical protein